MSSVQTILVLGREDLIESSKNKPIEEISISDFRGSISQFHTEPFAIFNDRIDTQTRLIKNRYGNDGMVRGK